MKKIFLIILYSLFISSLLFAQPTDLIISEYVEGTSNNKALEFYNGTGNAIDLGANGYAVEMYFNGSTSPGTTISLTGTVANDDVFVLAHSSAVPAILAVADQTNSASWYNGDDAIVLRKGATILDVIGQIGFDPGSEWGSGLTSTADNTLRRKAGTTVGDTNPNDVFDPSVEWDGYATDTFDGLGSPSPLPVELSSFSAVVFDNVVKLNWRTETEVNNYGFEIERLQDFNIKKLQVWETLGFVQGNGNSNSPKEYSFVDNNVVAGKYSYRLKQIDTDGQFEFSKVITVDLGSPTKFELSQNYPNPFNPTTTISLTLPESGNVKLTVYNIIGEQVAELVNGFKEAGVHTINFNSENLTAGGQGLNSGIYFYTLETAYNKVSRKMILLK